MTIYQSKPRTPLRTALLTLAVAVWFLCLVLAVIHVATAAPTVCC